MNRPPSLILLNLGGEGETADAINQQADWAMNAGWAVSHNGRSLQQDVRQGTPYVLCSNLDLPFPSDSVDHVITNGVPIDVNTWLGPGIQSSEIHRVLKPKGSWIDNGVVVFSKP